MAPFNSLEKPKTLRLFLDVNDDFEITPLDALVIINLLNRQSAGITRLDGLQPIETKEVLSNVKC